MQHLLTWELNIVKRLKNHPRATLLVTLGLLLFLVGGVNYYRIKILSFSKIPPLTEGTMTDIDIPVEIIIPSLELDLKVDPGNINDGIWQISPANATFLTISAPPGTVGNTVIYGHNKKKIFGNLPYLSVGQKVTVKTATGQIYNYEVYEKHFIGPDRVDLISPTETPELTIYTCWGLFDSQRAVVKARLMANE